ncbi:hypothetical protein BH20VER3_BH20VER3_10020 [soil metagenome]
MLGLELRRVRLKAGCACLGAVILPVFLAPSIGSAADERKAASAKATLQPFRYVPEFFRNRRSDGRLLRQDLLPPPSQRPTISGSRAILRNGVAYAPTLAPRNVKYAIWAANGLRHKPYRWGGGHRSIRDSGYDCSGTVSYALLSAGAIAAPIPSKGFIRYGRRGRGRWITVYARPGHTFALIAGLRLDTTDFRTEGRAGPRWHRTMRDTRGYVARHPDGM